MTKDIWDERRRGLEEEFFVKHNRKLMDKIRADQNREEAIKDLELAMGIKNQEALGRLVDLGVSPSTAMALSLVPLVTVAWSDGKLDDKERDAILKAASDQGIARGGPAHELLLSWLNQKPDDALFDAWGLYVRSMKDALPAPVFAALKAQIIDRAQHVAAATGGFLGMGQKVSELEQVQLERLAQAFHA